MVEETENQNWLRGKLKSVVFCVYFSLFTFFLICADFILTYLFLLLFVFMDGVLDSFVAALQLVMHLIAIIFYLFLVFVDFFLQNIIEWNAFGNEWSGKKWNENELIIHRVTSGLNIMIYLFKCHMNGPIKSKFVVLRPAAWMINIEGKYWFGVEDIDKHTETHRTCLQFRSLSYIVFELRR